VWRAHDEFGQWLNDGGMDRRTAAALVAVTACATALVLRAIDHAKGASTQAGQSSDAASAIDPPALTKKQKKHKKRAPQDAAGDMNLFLFEVHECTVAGKAGPLDPMDIHECTVRLESSGKKGDPRVEHMQHVLHTSVGSQLRVGVINGLMGTAIVKRIDSEFCVLACHLTEEPPRPSQLSLMVAMPRPAAFARLIMCAVCLGVKKIYVINTARTENTYWSTHVLRKEDIRAALIAGLGTFNDGCEDHVAR
jgi:hypothetical protein